mgnify:CR=1 FL=1
MKASVVIPTKDKISRLRLVLQAFESQVNDQVEIVVVFDGCSSETIHQFRNLRLSYEPVAVISKHNVGRSSARNLGIAKAKGDVIIFVDDDRIPAPDFIQKHMTGHEEPCVLLGLRTDVMYEEEELYSLYELGHVRDNPDCVRTRLLEGELQQGFPAFLLKSSLKWLLFYTGNVSVDREYLVKAGGFDENFKGWGHEDLDLGIRLHMSGIPFRRDDAIVNYHILHDDNFDIKQRKKESIRNLVYMIGKYKKHYISWILSLVYVKHKLFGITYNRKHLQSQVFSPNDMKNRSVINK